MVSEKRKNIKKELRFCSILQTRRRAIVFIPKLSTVKRGMGVDTKS